MKPSAGSFAVSCSRWGCTKCIIRHSLSGGFFFFQAEDGIRDLTVTGVQTCALPIFDLNLRATFFVSQGAIPHLRRAKGKIVNIADLAGLEPWPAYVPHCVSKAGVVMLTKALARALAPDIAVNAVAPGAVLLPEDWDDQSREHIRETTPLNRLGTPADVVAAVRFLLADTDFATGTVLVVDGGRLIRRGTSASLAAAASAPSTRPSPRNPKPAATRTFHPISHTITIATAR